MGSSAPHVLQASIVSEAFDPTLLRTFVTVARTRSVTQAARRLGLSQSAASLQIRRLEDAAGVTLLHRTKRGVQLSAAGEGFIVYAERILALNAEALQSVRPSRPPRTVRIGLPDVYAERYLPHAVEAFVREFDDVVPEIHCAVSTEVVGRFERGELDLALFIRHDPEVGGTVVGRDPLSWVCSAESDVAQCDPLPLALYPEYCVFRAHGLRALADAGRRFRVAYTSQSTSAIDIAIDRGWGVALKAARTVAPRWRTLTEADGLPPLEPIDLELRRSPVESAAPIDRMAQLLEQAVRDDISQP
jgi:DNA-binding transcriptional LysR family regulator